MRLSDIEHLGKRITCLGRYVREEGPKELERAWEGRGKEGYLIFRKRFLN